MKKATYRGKEVDAWESKEDGIDMWMIQAIGAKSGITVHVSELTFL